MAYLPEETLLIALFRQGRLLKILHDVTNTDSMIYEQFGETEATITTLIQLQNAQERLTHIPHVILQYTNSDEIGDACGGLRLRRQLFLEAN